MRTHTHAHLRAHTHAFTYSHTHTYTHIHTCTHTHIQTYTHIHVHIHKYAYAYNIHTHTHTPTYSCTHTHTHAHTHAHPHSHPHPHMRPFFESDSQPSTLQHTATHCNALQRTATPLQHPAANYKHDRCTSAIAKPTHCNTLQQHYNPPHHTTHLRCLGAIAKRLGLTALALPQNGNHTLPELHTLPDYLSAFSREGMHVADDARTHSDTKRRKLSAEPLIVRAFARIHRATLDEHTFARFCTHQPDALNNRAETNIKGNGSVSRREHAHTHEIARIRARSPSAHPADASQIICDGAQLLENRGGDQPSEHRGGDQLPLPHAMIVQQNPPTHTHTNTHMALVDLMALLRSLRYVATLILQNRINFVGLFYRSLLVFVS